MEEEKKPCPPPAPGLYINEISKLFHDHMRVCSEQIGLKGGYRQILMHLAHTDGITQLSLARATHLTAPTVSVTLKKMEAEALVCRKADTADLRELRVYLTDKGRALDEKLRLALDETEAVLLDGISESEKQTLLTLLSAMRRNMIRQFTEGGVDPHEKNF